MSTPNVKHSHTFKHFVPIYGIMFHVAFADTIEQGIKALPKACDNLFEEGDRDPDEAALTSFCKRMTIAVVFRTKDYAGSLVTHEAVHVAYGILFNAGLKQMTTQNDEAFAYLSGFVASFINNDYYKVVDAGKQHKPKGKA